MSDYSSNSGFEKPTPGSQAGTWGGTVNTNMDLIDEAINGIVTITLTAAGTSGAPNTMLITDGATSPARHAFIQFDDNAFGTNQDVYVQLTETGGTVDAERICWIKNNMSTGNDLYLFQGNYDAGRDYVVPQGKTALVRFTGGGSVTNCYCLPVLENVYVEGTITAVGAISGSNLSGTNTGDNPGVTSVGTSGALTGGPITGTGTITHLNTDGYKHIPSGGTVGQFIQNSAAGSGSWVTLTTSMISNYQTPAMYDNAGTPTLQAGITAAEYRTAIGAGTSDTTGTVTSVTGGSGLTGTVTTSGSLSVGPGQGIIVNADDVAIDYEGANNFIRVATDLEGTAIAVTDTIIYSDATDGNVKKGLISDLPGIGSSGTVTSVASGNGMNFTEITGAGSVVLGTPSSVTSTSTNSVTASSHTHAIDSTIARVDSPAFTGTPTAPTQTVGNSSTRLATTAFVNAEIANDAPLKDGTGATGTWGISISGNAATANSATSAATATSAAEVTSAAQPNITSVGTLSSVSVTGKITGASSLSLAELASAPIDVAGYGQVWVKSGTPNELYFTNENGVDIRLDTTTTGTVTSVSAGTGMNFTTITTSGSVSLDYAGSDSFIYAATDGIISTADYILFYDITDSTVKKDTVSALPFTNNIGDITGVTAGDGITGGGTSSTVTVTLGTPGTLTDATTNSVTSTSHTHAVTFPVPDSISTASTASTTCYPALFTSSGTGTKAVYNDSSLSYNASTNIMQCAGFTTSSRRELKNLISNSVDTTGLDRLMPITYAMKSDPGQKPRFGFFVDEVAMVYPELVAYDDDGIPSGVDYAALSVLLLARMKELEMLI